MTALINGRHQWTALIDGIIGWHYWTALISGQHQWMALMDSINGWH
jgi:hypothetical protein